VNYECNLPPLAQCVRAYIKTWRCSLLRAVHRVSARGGRGYNFNWRAAIGEIAFHVISAQFGAATFQSCVLRDQSLAFNVHSGDISGAEFRFALSIQWAVGVCGASKRGFSRRNRPLASRRSHSLF
jgi:hypothetical protein